MTSSVSRKRATRLRQRPWWGGPYHRANLSLCCPSGQHPLTLPRQTRGILPTIDLVSPAERPTDGVTGVSPLPDLEAHINRIAEEGYTVLPDAIEPDLVDEIDEALLKLEHDLGTVPADNLFEGVRTMRVYNLLGTAPPSRRSPCTPTCCLWSRRVLDPGLLISSLSSIAIGPDEQAQPIHADDQLIPLTRPHVPIICNTMWAITDFTEENGATRIIPGSHLRDEAPNPLEHYETIPAEMPKGSVLVWVGSLWHGGGANRTGHPPCRYRHELLRRLHPPAGEPAARDPARTGQDVPAPIAGVDRLLGLQRPRRPHRQATPGQGRPRRGRGCRHGLGPAQDLIALRPPAAPPGPPATGSRAGRSGSFPRPGARSHSSASTSGAIRSARGGAG